MARNLTYPEYHRRVFNKALIECMCKIHGAILNDCDGCNDPEDVRLGDMAARLCNTFYTDMLKLDTSTVRQTKERLSESIQFIHDCVETAENIADDKTEAAEEEKMELPADQEVELSEEDKEVIDTLFTNKEPKLQVDQIRDATVAALLAEDKKAEEIRNAVDVAQSQVAAGEDPKVMEETVNRLNRRGPTSLMHAIINNVSSQAIKNINENDQFTTVAKALSENKEEIRNRATMIYTLYEMASVFGIKTYTDYEVRALATSIYNEK